MNNTPLKRKPLARWVAFALAATTAAGVAQAAAPLAGTEIKNLATVSYEDENGNKYTAQSNEAVITVKEQYRATLENDKTLIAAPGQTVYFPHTLVNEGNVGDTYALTTDVAAGVKIFEDTNGNGQPDAGEPEITSMTLAAGETGNIVVSYVVPSTAVDGDVATVVLTATSAGTDAEVTDIGGNSDGDTVDNSATNNDTVTVTSGPVLVLNKASVIDTATQTITYTLTVKNTGSSDAKLVDIIDAVPMVDHDDNSSTAKLPLTNVTIVSVNGLLDGNDIVPVGTVTVAESGTDLNDNGTTNDAAVDVIKATDAVLSPNTTVSIVYSAEYDATWGAGSSIDNTFITQSDNDGDGSKETTTPSNTTHNEIIQTYDVSAEDDGDLNATSLGANDGHDDNTDTNTDGTGDDDTQYVDTISAGDTVIFTHTIENKGNGDDVFNLNVTNTDFPAGTVFTLWNEDGTVQLTDSDSDGIPDTGVLGQNETMKVVVKAGLPSGVSKAGESIATLSATSSGDDTQVDDTELKLGKITAPAVDLSATAIVDGTGFQPNSGFSDDGTENAHDEGPVLLAEGIVGGTVTFPMSVANEAGSPDSFILGVGTVNALPDDWTVVFKDLNGDTITATPFIPAGATFDYIAEVTISSDPSKALGDSDRGTDVDGNDITNTSTTTPVAGTQDLTNQDNDNDYAIDFTVESAVNDSHNDTITHTVDVADIKSVTITPDGQNQIQPGGTVDYSHKLTNAGNIDEAVELTSANSDPDWSSTTLIKDGNGDLVEVSTLTSTDSITVTNPDGAEVTEVVVPLTDTDGDGVVEIPLKPGQYINVTNKVFAPTDAAQGEVDTTTLTLKDPDVGGTAPILGTVRSEAKDTSTVILGQVRLDKTVAVDADCNGEADDATSFAAIQTAKVEPGQCATWKIVAKNEGDALVKNVIVNDTVPAYTTFLANSFRVFNNAGKAVTPATNEVDGDVAEIDSVGKVTYYLGANPVPATATDPAKGGELKAGETSTVYFTVTVDQ